MFGFLKPHHCGESYRRYRHAYARCCQFQRHLFGVEATVALSYESVFLYLLSVDTGVCYGPSPNNVTCCRLRSMGDAKTAEDSDLGRFCSAFGMLLAQVKLDDDHRDGPSLLSRIARIRLARRFRKARHILDHAAPELLTRIDQFISEHLVFEASDIKLGIAEYSSPTGKAFGEVFASVPGELSSQQRSRMRQTGQHIGQAIVAFDCAVDFDRDLRRGDFNPLNGLGDVDRALQFATEEIIRAGWLCQECTESQLAASHLRAAFYDLQSRRRECPDAASGCCKSSQKSPRSNSYGVATNRDQSKRAARRLDSDRSKRLADREATQLVPNFLQRQARAGICDCDCGVACLDGLCCSGDFCSGCHLGCDVCCDLSQQKKKKRKESEATVSRDPRRLVGSTGVAVSDLKPLGIVSIEGREHPAKLEPSFSQQAEFVNAGQNVEIIDSQAFVFLVRPSAI